MRCAFGATIPLKRAIFEAWKTELQTRYCAAQKGQQTARSGTRVDGTHRPATRGERGAVTAQGYLALGLGKRAGELEEQLQLMDQVGFDARSEVVTGALLRLGMPRAEHRWVALLPGGDATWLQVEDGSLILRVQVLSLRSPLIHQIRDCEPGDVEEISIGDRIEEVELLEIH